MNWGEKLDENTDGLMTKINARFAELQTQVDSLEAARETPSDEKSEALIKEQLAKEIPALMGTLVTRAENLLESTNQFNDFKKQQEIINKSLQAAMSDLRRQLIGGQSVGGEDDGSKEQLKSAAAQRELEIMRKKEMDYKLEIKNLKAKVAASENTEKQTKKELEKVKAERDTMKKELINVHKGILNKSEKIKSLEQKVAAFELILKSGI